MAKDTKRTPWLEKTDKIIPRWVKSKGTEFELEYRKRWVLTYWRDIVGDVIAQHVELMGIRKKTLLYYSSSPAWNNEMRLLMPQIVDKMNRFAGCEIIREVRLTHRWEKPEAGDVLAFRAWLRQEDSKVPDFRKEREQTLLTSEEEDSAKALSASSADDDLGNLLGQIYRKNLQLRKVKSQHGWVPCSDCGTLTEPKPVRIAGADRKETSLKAMQLVMLYRVLPPSQLTEDAVDRALYALRFDLHRPKDYVAPKRYSVIKRGKEGEAARKTLSPGAKAFDKK